MSDPTTPTPTPKPDRKPYVLLVVFAAALIYLLAFALLNTQHVNVSFVVFSTTTSLIWLMLASVALGLILGVVGTLWLRRRRSH